MLSSNFEEIFRLRNHNKTLVTKIKKLKSSRKIDQSTDIEGKLLDKQEENRSIRRHNEDLKEQLKKSEDHRKSHVEVIKNFQNDNMQLENKLEKIQNETLKPQETKIQLSAQINAKKKTLVKENDIGVNPRTWVTLFGKRISTKTEKCTSVEGLTSPRPRFYQALDRGFVQPSTEVFLNPRSRY